MRRENSPSQSEIVGENVESKGLDIEDSPNVIVNIVVEYICLFAIFHPFYDANGDRQHDDFIKCLSRDLHYHKFEHLRHRNQSPKCDREEDE